VCVDIVICMCVVWEGGVCYVQFLVLVVSCVCKRERERERDGMSAPTRVN